MDRIKGRTTQYLRDRVVQVKRRGQSPGLNLRRSTRRPHFNRLSQDIAQSQLLLLKYSRYTRTCEHVEPEYPADFVCSPQRVVFTSHNWVCIALRPLIVVLHSAAVSSNL